MPTDPTPADPAPTEQEWAHHMTGALAHGGLIHVEQRIKETHRIMRHRPYDTVEMLRLVREMKAVILDVEDMLVEGWNPREGYTVFGDRISATPREDAPATDGREG